MAHDVGLNEPNKVGTAAAEPAPPATPPISSLSEFINRAPSSTKSLDNKQTQLEDLNSEVSRRALSLFIGTPLANGGKAALPGVIRGEKKEKSSPHQKTPPHQKEPDKPQARSQSESSTEKRPIQQPHFAPPGPITMVCGKCKVEAPAENALEALDQFRKLQAAAAQAQPANAAPTGGRPSETTATVFTAPSPNEQSSAPSGHSTAACAAGGSASVGSPPAGGAIPLAAASVGEDAATVSAHSMPRESRTDSALGNSATELTKNRGSDFSCSVSRPTPVSSSAAPSSPVNPPEDKSQGRKTNETAKLGSKSSVGAFFAALTGGLQGKPQAGPSSPSTESSTAKASPPGGATSSSGSSSPSPQATTETTPSSAAASTASFSSPASSPAASSASAPRSPATDSSASPVPIALPAPSTVSAAPTAPPIIWFKHIQVVESALRIGDVHFADSVLSLLSETSAAVSAAPNISARLTSLHCRVLMEKNQFEDVEQKLTETIKSLASTQFAGGVCEAYCWYTLAQFHHRRNNPAEAESARKKAIAIANAALGEKDPEAMLFQMPLS